MKPTFREIFGMVLMVVVTTIVSHYVSPWLAIPGMALAMNPINLGVSQMFNQGAQAAWRLGQPLEIQDQPLYSLITLPAAINPAGGNNFFADAAATVGLQRTNLTRPNQVPPGTNFEIHGIRIFFLAPITVLFTSYVTAIRDAFLVLTVNNSQRLTRHLRDFTVGTIYAPSVSAAAGDNPIVTDQGIDGVFALALPIPLQGATTFGVTVTFITDVAALGSTVMGVELLGLLDRGNIKLDQSPVRSAASLGM
jgi:hypothetical protein